MINKLASVEQKLMRSCSFRCDRIRN